jgi:hydrophobic/amphiphilic exporter-1 (mainly G- bacteria), HAE1 family
MSWLVRVCVKRPVFSVVLMLLLLVVGGAGYTRLGLEQLPNADIPIVVVSTPLPGAAPSEVESEITDKVEAAVNTIGGIEELRSTSSEGLSQVIISFDLDKNLDNAVDDVRDKVNSVVPDLPQGIQTPVVSKLDLNAAPVLLVALNAATKGQQGIGEATELADKVVRRRLESLSGVGKVSIVAGRKRQINIWLDPIAMRASGVTPGDIERALQTQNLAAPGGAVESGADRISVRVRGRVDSASKFADVVIKQQQATAMTLSNNAHPTSGYVRLGDVARVEDGLQEASSFVRLNGNDVVLLSIRKQSGQNTVAVVDALKQELEAIRSDLPAGASLELVNDSSLTVRTAVHSVIEHLILGSLLAALVVFFFLGNARSTLIAAVAIPISLVGTFAVMWAQGFTLNILTLLALALAVGIVIDDAIVVLENIVKMMEEKKAKPFVASVLATKEIALPVLATTLSLLAVFLPVAFMGGIVGRFLKSFGLTMAFAIAISMLVSFSLTPSMSARLLQLHEGLKKSMLERLVDWLYRPIERAYMFMLGLAMRFRLVVVVACLAALVAIVPLAQSLPSSFLPNDDVAQFDINIRAPEGTSLAATKLVAERFEAKAKTLGEVRSTLLTVGADEAATPNLAKVTVLLTDPKKRAASQAEVMNQLRKELGELAEEGVRVSVVNPGDGGEASQTVQYSVRGPSVQKLSEIAERVTADLKTSNVAVDVDNTVRRGAREATVEIDRERAEALGVNVAELADVVRVMLTGKKVSTYAERGETFEVRMHTEKSLRIDVDMLHAITVPSTKLERVSLDNVVKLVPALASTEIKRLGRQKEVTIVANAAAGAGDSTVEKVLLDSVAKIGLPEGYTIVPAGNSKELGKTVKAFAFAFALSFIFMYLVLAAQFESWIHPITILITLPLTVPFGLVSLKFFGQGLNLFTALGLLVLFGVVKKNAILQIDHTNALRAAGLPRAQAILDANRYRLRPILMTTIAFVVGMLPLLFSKGVGAGQSQSTAGIILGGQTLSLLLTLLAVPVLYSLIDDLVIFVARLRKRAQVDRGEAELDRILGQGASAAE